jgi:aminoglycoside phosphotransferase (APT) family kinase protein
VNDLELSALLHHLGLEAKAEFVGQGVSARVWRVQVRRDTLALRVTRADTDENPRMKADYAVRHALQGTGARVAMPMHVGVWNGLEYGLDYFVEGETPTELTRVAAVQLGETLAALHALPHARFGLLENRSDSIVGIASTPETGLLSRLSHPFPLESLLQSVVATVAPEFLPALEDLEPELLETLNAAPFAVCHSDLHAGQMIVRDGQLIALLDFGDAVIGAAVWDIASFAYFHGWDKTAWLLEGYGRDVLRSAQLFSVILCLHHLNRSVQQPGRQQKALERLSDTLERLGFRV